MIVDFIVTLVFGFLTGLLALIPTFTLPSLSGFGTSVGGTIGAASGYFPVGTLGFCMAAVLLCRLWLLGWTFAVWLYRLIPFKAT